MKLIIQATLLFFPLLVYSQEWQQVGNLNRGVISMFTDTADNLLYVGGEFRFNGTDTVNGVFSWDGTAINALGAGLYDACGSLTCHAPNTFARYKDEIYTGANFHEITPGTPSRGIARWNGSEWLPVPPGLFQDNNDYAGFMIGSYVHEGLLYVVGAFRTVGTETANSVASWNGSSWQTYGVPSDTQDHIPLNYRVIVYKDELYVGGNCYNIIDGNVNFDIMRYDGTAWHQVGAGIFGGLSFISDMVIYHDELYVSGPFNAASGNAGNMIMRWDGEQWHDVGGGICSPGYTITDMLVYDDKLYVVGAFDCVGDGVPANGIAVWDGERWCSFGNSYFNNKITCIGVYDGEFYIGGGFTEISGYPIKYFAKYIGDHSTDTCSAAVSITPEPQRAGNLVLSPNPAGDQLRIQWPNGQFLPGSLRVFDVTGKEATGHTQMTVNQQSAQLQTGLLPAGLYFLQLRMEGGQVWSGRFVKE